jgi:hypothetical protein
MDVTAPHVLELGLQCVDVEAGGPLRMGTLWKVIRS